MWLAGERLAQSAARGLVLPWLSLSYMSLGAAAAAAAAAIYLALRPGLSMNYKGNVRRTLYVATSQAQHCFHAVTKKYGVCPK